MNKNEHKPGCMANIQCAVYHPDGVCPGPYGKCTCNDAPLLKGILETIKYDAMMDEAIASAGLANVDIGRNENITAIQENGDKFVLSVTFTEPKNSINTHTEGIEEWVEKFEDFLMQLSAVQCVWWSPKSDKTQWNVTNNTVFVEKLEEYIRNLLQKAREEAWAQRGGVESEQKQRMFEAGKAVGRENMSVQILGQWQEGYIRQGREEGKRELVEKYGDFRNTQNGQTLRYHVLPHTQHLPGDDGSSHRGGDTKTMNDLHEFRHGEEGTHYICQEQLRLYPFAGCCGCTGHTCLPNN